MRTTLLLFLFFLGKLSFSQTIIKLTHEAGPMHDYHYVNLADTAFVFVYRDEDMGKWTNPAYSLKMNYSTGKYDFPDGKYVVYINDTLDKEVFIKNKLPDSTWINYYPNGNKKQLITYKDGKLHGNSIYYKFNRNIWAISSFENGILNSSIQYYESGCIQIKQTRKEGDMIEETFPDDCKKVQPQKKVLQWKNPEKQMGYNLSYSNQTQSVLEVGVSKWHKYRVDSRPNEDDFKPSSRPYVKDYWSSGVSLNFVLADHFVFAPKLFTNISCNWFSAQLNLSAYTDLKQIEPVFTPEIGIGRIVGIRYGYNFKLLNKSFPEMGDHRLVIFFNLYFPHFKHTM